MKHLQRRGQNVSKDTVNAVTNTALQTLEDGVGESWFTSHWRQLFAQDGQRQHQKI
jgi:hypothetical protein